MTGASDNAISMKTECGRVECTPYSCTCRHHSSLAKARDFIASEARKHLSYHTSVLGALDSSLSMIVTKPGVY